MRDRLTEWLPLLLAGVLVLAFQMTRTGGVGSLFSPHVDPGPTPTVTAVVRDTYDARALVRPRATQAPVAPSCQPRYANRLASLRNALGAAMGDPVECARPIDNSGDTEQRTTTGLAYYRSALNAACFTTGWDHWALMDAGRLVHWTGDAVDPPADATPVN